MSDDNVNHPDHYTRHASGVECLDVVRHMNFNLGNALKYIWRAGLKGDAIEDLRKSVFYLNDEIKRLQMDEPAVDAAEMIIGIDMARDDGNETDELLGSNEFKSCRADFWSDDEIAQCLQMMDDGLLRGDIAVKLHRGLGDVTNMIEQLSEPVLDAPVEKPTPPPVASKPLVAKMDKVAVEKPAESTGDKEPWGVGSVSDAELARMVELWGTGLPISAIADSMGIKPKRVSNVIARNRDEFPKRQSGGQKPLSSISAILKSVCGPAPWTPKKDLTLATFITDGNGIGSAAGVLRIPREQCVGRWAALAGDNWPADSQEKTEYISYLLKELQARAMSTPPPE